MNDITELLALEDPNAFVSDIQTVGNRKTITLETHPDRHFCPKCGFRMYSRGIKSRTINHPIMQDVFIVTIILKQRRWRCSNKSCLFECNESFNFVKKHRRNTNASELLIIEAFRDLSRSATAIANQFHVSDTYVLDVFDKYVRMPRLSLTDAISVDEVHIEMDDHCKYALVIQDFHTGEPIDILRSRRDNVTEPYFFRIPLEERLAVKYLVSDMYNPYINYVARYFPNAVSVVDSFHVVQWIVRSLDVYFRALLKHYKQRDAERAEKLSKDRKTPVSLPVSDEVYLLQKYRWLVLSNHSSIKYHDDLRMDPHFHRLMNTYDYERMLLSLDSKMKSYRDLKELYVQFNARNAGNPMQAAIELDALIKTYKESGHGIFVSFAGILLKNREYIINSFIMVERMNGQGTFETRLSNGPVESLNRKIKDLRRLGRGFRSFEHFRNRFLFASRFNSPFSAVESEDVVQYFDNSDDYM